MRVSYVFEKDSYIQIKQQIIRNKNLDIRIQYWAEQWAKQQQKTKTKRFWFYSVTLQGKKDKQTEGILFFFLSFEQTKMKTDIAHDKNENKTHSILLSTRTYVPT